MADLKISALTASTTPLAGTEVLPIVQSSTTKKVSVDNLTAGRAVSALSFASTTGATFATSSGNVGVGAASSAWGSGKKVVQVLNSYIGAFTGGAPLLYFGNNHYDNGTNNVYLTTGNNATLYQQSQTGEHRFFTAPSGTAGNAVSFTQVVTIDASGNQTLNAGNLVIGTSGKGIDFSATSGTGTSELLADYEEGTWTPGFAAWTTAPTINASYCRYTKVGRQVTILMLCQNGVCGSTGQPITGLPFTSNSVSVASFRDASGAASTTFGIVDIGTQITSITAVNFTGLFWGMSATYFV